MSKLVAGVAVAIWILAPAAAAERTVILAVQNVYCAACPHTVR
jgi:hypothetical protein